VIKVFSIVTSNYLAEARVLMDSIKSHWPNAERTVFVADSIKNKIKAEKEGFQVVEASSLKIPRFRHMAFAFSPSEFCFVLKPFCASHLLKTDNCKAVVYFDADMMLFQKPLEVEEMVKNHSVILSPHRLDPGLKRTVGFEHLQDGLFNAGFFAASKCKESFSMLEWWANQIREPSNIRAEWRWDQGWLNLVPLYFPKSGILKKPNFNVAFWNLSERKIHQDKHGNWKCGGDKLTLFHFSLFDLQNPEKLTGARDYCPPGFNEMLLPLIREYAQRMSSAGWIETHSLPYDFSFFSDGKRISKAHRRFFRQRMFSEIKEDQDPFDPKMEPSGLKSLYKYDHLIPRIVRFLKGTC